MTYYAPEKVQGAKTDQLFRVVGLLPEEKVAQVLDFAQFIFVKTFLSEHYQRYRHGEVSLGRLAEELGMTTWGLSHLLEELGWSVSNLPAVQ